MKIVITGSSTGIGRAIATDLLSLGHEVWGVARRDQSDLKKKYSSTFVASQIDVSDWNQVEQLQQEVKKRWVSIDGFINCAGFQGEIGSFSKTDSQKWSDTVIKNISMTFFPLRAFHSLLLRKNEPAKVICFSGGGATQPRPNFSAYAAAKAGIVRLVETIAEEWKDDQIEINAIAPGRIDTAMMDEIIAKGPDLVGAKEYEAAQKQKESKEDALSSVLTLVRWLLSSESNGITGKLISAQWDQWEKWPQHLSELQTTDLYTLRRITGRERGTTWGDKS